MEKTKQTIEHLINLMNIGDFRVVEQTEDKSRLNIFFEDSNLFQNNLPNIVNDFNHLCQLIAKKYEEDFRCVDINNYRLERERIISDIARAAARKALMTKTEIDLPIMNSYERRIIHAELSMRPDIKTESEGFGKSRYVKVKPIIE
ncbi:MAG: hypothetical protein COV57_01415 [Candidatus Liptonbacteria bacterium CG11_big_fil_rev_8_21_14_0_20_35_14]|uniref:R3H domain-containing protein n=1 Tax=Candidatus Liptonbacteria bacterium CG11_big_fil_rev_8_21_14_0_20_35_14 TaxID=1974634 RepID=A0A2H0NA34_9BACT|nr:MAG: hypothetical protein COV57_01415 [Candidatus Liptonbacteria bacterium CG11_big_fil_rev_8_21_14_0_20_35_14]